MRKRGWARRYSICGKKGDYAGSALLETGLSEIRKKKAVQSDAKCHCMYVYVCSAC